jgi:8-oxoguanine DNA glycosylase, N-terminal domain
VVNRWSRNSADEWIGVFGGRVWRLAQTDDHLLYQVYTKQTVQDSQPPSTDQFKLVNKLQVADDKLKKEMSNHIEDIIDCRDNKSAVEDTVSSTLDATAVLPVDIHSAMLCDYMRLSVNLQSLYDDWTKRGESFFTFNVILCLSKC